MDSITLHYATYTAFNQTKFAEQAEKRGLQETLATYIIQHQQDIQSRHFPIEHHLMVSTSIVAPFNQGEASWDAFKEQLSSNTSPQVFMNAYECASWGYALRYITSYYPDQRYVMISIIDANPQQYSVWTSSEQWGYSGFGLCTLIMELNQEAHKDIDVCLQITSNPVAEFAIKIKKWLSTEKHLTAALPFFPNDAQAFFDKTLTDCQVLPSQYDSQGHCFGSDPWLSLILNQRHFQLQPELTSCLVCSFALNGYYALAKVSIDANAHFAFRQDAN